MSEYKMVATFQNAPKPSLEREKLKIVESQTTIQTAPMASLERETPKVVESQFSIFPRVINGSIAGITAITCVFPIDLCKTRLQNQQPGPQGQLLYRSLADCAIKTFRSEGFFGMYRGAGVNYLLITPEKCIKLVGNDFFRHQLTLPDGKITLGREVLAGAGVGLVQTIVVTPMELLKIQLQDAGRSASVEHVVSNKRDFSFGAAPQVTLNKAKLSATTIALDLVRKRGIFGLYQGCGVTALRDMTFASIYFPLFANVNAMGKKQEGSDKVVLYHSFLSGCIGGMIAAFLVTPYDVIKTRLQTLSKGSGEQYYSGFLDCFRKVLAKEGPKAFFKGALCRIMIIAPKYGIAQAVYFLGIGEYLVGVKKT